MRFNRSPEASRSNSTNPESSDILESLSDSDRNKVIDMMDLADSIAEKRKTADAGESTKPLGDESTADRQKLMEQLHGVLSSEVLQSSEINEEEDLLEEVLIEFQEDSTLPQEEKDRIIFDIIDRTQLDSYEKESLVSKLKSSLGKAALKVILKFKREKNNEDDDEDTHELELDDPDPERQEIIEIIREADAIEDREARIIALTTIGQKYKKGEFVDLALLAARTMQDSVAHEGRKARKMQQTKKAGVTNSAYNQLLLEISNANNDTRYGLVAAERIDMPWLRNKTIANRLASIPELIDELQAGAKKEKKELKSKIDNLTEKIDKLYEEYGGHQAYNNGDIPQDIIDKLDDMVRERDDMVRERRKSYDSTIDQVEELKDTYENADPSSLYEGNGKKKYGREAAFDQAEYSLDPTHISKVGLRNFFKKQRTISKIAIEKGDEKTAQLLRPGLLKRKTLKTIAINKARQL